jgi:hypothetical protein
MRPVEAVEWAKAFDVEVTDLPAVLRVEVARVDGVRNELTTVYRELADGPDQDIRTGLWRSLSALGAAQARLMDVAADARRSA